MCEFISVVKLGETLWYLTTPDIESKKGKELRHFCEYPSDLRGHGAIRYFYDIPDNVGEDLEFINFRDPANLPAELVSAMVNGKFVRWFGEPPYGLLNEKHEDGYTETYEALRRPYVDMGVRSQLPPIEIGGFPAA